MTQYKKTSWHYRMASVPTGGWPSQSICVYFRQVIAGLFLFSTITMLVGVVALSNLFGLFALITGMWSFDFPAAPVNVVSVIIGVFIVATFGQKYFAQKYKRTIRKDFTPPSPAKLRWMAFKEKVCPTIEFID